MDLKEEIKKYTAYGIPVFPVVGKIPVVSWKSLQNRYPTNEEILEWEKKENITGIAGTTGEFSGIIVIDCDIKNKSKRCSQEIIDRLRSEGHPEIQTGSGGSHFIVKYNPSLGFTSNDGVLQGVDIKGAGGCFTLPPSKAIYGQDEIEYAHFNGNEYKWVKDFNRAELKEFPEWLLGMVHDKRPKQKADWSEVMQGVGEGNRNGTAASVAGKILLGLKVEDWESIGWASMEAWNNKCNPPLPIKELRNTFESVGRTEMGRRQGLPVSEQKDRKITAVNELLGMTPNANPFILQGMIVEGSVNALTSDSGKGKSLLALKAVEAIVKGEKFLGEFPTKQSKTLIIDLEMSQDDLIERTQSIIHDKMDGLDFYHCQSFNICDDSDYNWLKDIISKNGYKLIVLDTFSMAHNKNENDNSEVNIVNHRLLNLINECNITILFLHHHRKLAKGEQMSQSSSRGATDIIGKTASHLLLDTRDIMVALGEEGEQKTMLKGIRIIVEQMKRRRATGFDMFAVKVWYNPETRQTSFLFDGFDEKAENATDKTKTLLLSKLEVGEEYTRKDMQALVGKSSNLSNAIKELIEQDKILGFRMPIEDEQGENGKNIPRNTKIYYLTSETPKMPVQAVQKLV